MNFHTGLPNDHGHYVFELKNGTKLQGFYSSFRFPDDDKVARVANLKYQYFWYLGENDIKGYYL